MFLILLVLLVPVVVIRYRKSRKGLSLFAAAAPSGERESMLKELRLRMIASDIFFLLFSCFLIIALAGPRWGLRITADHRRGVDLVFAFDLSRSMNVEDCHPSRLADRISRLERGKEIAWDLAAALADVRIGAAVGKGRGVLAVPLTYDSETIMAFLYSLDSRTVSGRGTDLESLITAASSSFQDSMPSRRVIILFSDGEALSGSFQTAVDKMRKAGIALTAVGLGSDQGGSVPVEKSIDAPDGMLLTPDGKAVVSSRQGGVLRNGAEKTGGIYVDGNRNDAAQVLADYANSLSAESRLSGYRREANPRWQIFVFAAMICLGAARILGFMRRRRKNRWILAALIYLFLLSSCAKTQGKLFIMEANFYNARGFYTEAISSYLKALDYNDAAPYAEYGLGAAYFALEEGTAAMERYRTAEKGLLTKREDHSELRYRIQYNSGIIHFEKGEYSEAVQAFRDALKTDGSRIEAKRNLELSLLTIARINTPQTASAEGRSESSREASNGASPVIFEYLRQKEQEQWKSREWAGEDDSRGPDY
jgi:Ca-activated chloride channel family protein